MAKRRLGSVLCLLLLTAGGVIGCSGKGPPGPPLGTLQGRIMLDSEKVLMGNVVAAPLDPNGAITRGPIRRDGTYIVEKVTSGPVRLFLELPPLPPDADPRYQKVAPKAPPGAPKMEQGPGEPPPGFARMELPEEELKAWASVVKIPKVYLNPQKTPLSTFVRPGDEPTEYDIHLSSKPSGPPDPEDLPSGAPPPPPTPPGSK